MITCDTAGRIVLWNLSRKSSFSTEDISERNILHFWKVHQSGIKALDIKVSDDGEIIVSTGGDDGSIAVIEIPCSLDPEILKKIDVKVFKAAHASSVTGIHIIPRDKDGLMKVCSVSIDQKLKIFDFSTEDIKLMCCSLVDVPDVGDMAVLGNSYVIVGHGLQVFERRTI